jgi:hypothetical protein
MGADFCGYRLFATHRLIRTRSKTKMKRSIKEWNELYKNGKLDLHRVLDSVNSWKAHIKHGDCYHLENKILSKISFNIK